ncbi:MAG TPA: alpha amylase C-terminal domain-containing protein, partial [Alistipes communis]|nr:alpha amylase C-terminal domain-containing protein [Alistipes communis]
PIGETNRKGTLGSYYAVRDYCGVNPEFGTMADFDRFVSTAHGLGLKVLLDWVANHTARDARWVTECPADWYERDAAGEPVVPNGWDDTAKLNYANRAVWQGQIDAMRFWLAEHGVDGFRCDMAMLVPTAFWQEAAAQLREVKHNLFMLAEAEQADLFDRAFDACYAWEFHHIVNDIAQGRRRVWDLRNYLYADRDRYPRSAMRLMFTSNHDENSWNGSEFRRLGDAAGIMAALTFVLPQSMPLVYTGQEFGYDHSFAFFDRDPMVDPRPGRFTELYRLLCLLKHRNRALQAGERGGSFVEIENNAKDCLMTFVREVEGNRVLCVMNLSPYTIHADFNTGIYQGEYADALTGNRIVVPYRVEQDMAPWSYRILIRE